MANGDDKKKKEHANIKPTEGFEARTKEAEDNLAPAVDKPKKPPTGPKPSVTVGKIYTLKGAAKEALDDDEKKKAAANAKKDETK